MNSSFGFFVTLGVDFDVCPLVTAVILSDVFSCIGKTTACLFRKLVWIVLVVGK